MIELPCCWGVWLRLCVAAVAVGAFGLPPFIAIDPDCIGLYYSV